MTLWARMMVAGIAFLNVAQSGGTLRNRHSGHLRYRFRGGSALACNVRRYSHARVPDVGVVNAALYRHHRAPDEYRAALAKAASGDMLARAPLLHESCASGGGA